MNKEILVFGGILLCYDNGIVCGRYCFNDVMRDRNSMDRKDFYKKYGFELKRRNGVK